MNECLMNRRAFFARTGAACIGMMLAGCSRLSGTATSEPNSENYYVANKKMILKELDGLANPLWQVTAEKYGREVADSLIDGALADFETVLTEIPYIGGDDNSLTENLYVSVMALAFYRQMQSTGRTVDETGELLYLGTDRMLSGSIISGMMGRSSNNDSVDAEWKKAAKKSQERTYPEDWVFEFVSGKGKEFDYGIDYIECGICKYFKTHQAEELTPYLCLLDFPMSRAMNTGLVRTQTLGQGGSCCDFRYKQGRSIEMEWTPKFLQNEGVES